MVEYEPEFLLSSTLTELLEEGVKVVALLELVGTVQLNHGELGVF